MKIPSQLSSLIITTTFSTIILLSACSAPSPEGQVYSKEALGKRLFNDVSLSNNGIQACASCHNSKHAFINTHANKSSLSPNGVPAVALGQDGKSLGDINPPSIAYSAFVPEFHFDTDKKLFIGGLFLNGRSPNLENQAKHPFLNSIEMQTSQQAVVDKVQKKYGKALRALYGSEIFDHVDNAFSAITNSIAQFEKTEQVSPFNSKFDKVLKGLRQFSELEQQGHDLFVDENRANCVACHPVPKLTSHKMERLFTDFSYDNLGVPVNTAVRALNDKGQAYVDNGLYENPLVNNTELKGAFRVSGLRNVAVTAPYMHNGVFNNLETVVHFYNSRDVKGAINPETQRPWRQGEVDENKNTEELGNLELTDKEIKAIVAFMQTLTDERYENLIPSTK